MATRYADAHSRGWGDEDPDGCGPGNIRHRYAHSVATDLVVLFCAHWPVVAHSPSGGKLRLQQQQNDSYGCTRPRSRILSSLRVTTCSQDIVQAAPFIAPSSVPWRLSLPRRRSSSCRLQILKHSMDCGRPNGVAHIDANQPHGPSDPCSQRCTDRADCCANGDTDVSDTMLRPVYGSRRSLRNPRRVCQPEELGFDQRLRINQRFAALLYRGRHAPAHAAGGPMCG